MHRYVLIILLYVLEQNSANILIPCMNDKECDAIVPETTCSLSFGGYCQCQAGFTFSSDARVCLKEVLYGDFCIEGSQCSHMLGAQCKNGMCECAPELTYVRGQCRRLVNLNSECRDEIDCFFGYNRESTVCLDKKCQCASGFYQRFNVCRRKSSNGEYCIVSQDCVDSDSTCSNFICTSSVGTQTSKRDVSVQTTQSLEEGSISDVRIVKSSSFPNKRNYIKYTKLDNSEAISFDDESTQFGESCDEEKKPCAGLKYSICRRNFCQCQDGFYQKDGICKAELGEMVESEEFCGSGRFERGKCVCQNNQFYNPNMRACLKASTGISQSCTQNAQCSPYGAAYCPKEIPQQCRCFEYAEYNEKTELCELKVGLGEYCETSETCKVENTECTSLKTCECKSNFIAQNGSCKPGISAICETHEDCAFENSACKIEAVDETKTEKKCHCKDGFVNVGRNSCLEEAKNYDANCSESEQCRPLLGDKASCIENKCLCSEGKFFNEGRCNDKKELNEQCTKSAECYVASDPETVECRNGVCSCKFNYTRDSLQNRCRPREKNSSNTVSPLKVITLILIASATMVVASALRDAYAP